MTPQQIATVRRSFAQIVPIKEFAAALFYERLFEIDPSTRALFSSDLKAQGSKLIMAIAMVVHALDRIEPMLGTLKELARRNVDYGVQERHYESVGAALLWTLEQGLGDGFTPDVSEAWTAAYDLLSRTMIAAAYEPLKKAA